MKANTNQKLLCKAVAVILVLIIGLAFMPANADAATKKPAKVRGVKITKVTTTTVALSWKKAKRAKGYCVYKRLAGTKKWTKSATTKKNKATAKKLKSEKNTVSK